MDEVEFQVRVLTQGDEDALNNIAPGVFDKTINPALTREFLADPRHHLAVALESGVVVGMASAVDYMHPDKPRELWINEVGVAEPHRGRGIAKRLLQALFEVGRGLGCRQAWVLTNRSNAPAMQLYSSGGGSIDADDTIMFTFHLDGRVRG
jgi:aminoglycoside 6'-N-acetyltransferase I